MDDIQLQEGRKLLCIQPEGGPIFRGHPVHRQVNIAALVKISPGPGAEENQFPGSMPAGQLTELTIDLFHGYLLGRFPAVIKAEMPAISFLLS